MINTYLYASIKSMTINKYHIHKQYNHREKSGEETCSLISESYLSNPQSHTKQNVVILEV